MEYLKKNIKEESETEKKKKDDAIKAKWTHEQEELLAKWCEISASYRWLHEKAEKKFRAKHYKYTIPVIIMSTLAGTANFGIDSYVPEEYKQYAQMGIGSVNILAGIISTLQNFFRYAELMESHRSCGISWSKLQRDISVELALDPLRRKHAYDFLKICRAEYDRLMEQSPSIPVDIIDMFKKYFKKDNNFKKPDICNGIETCIIYKPSHEEKISEILVKAGNKLKNKKKIFNNINNKKQDLKKKIDKSTDLLPPQNYNKYDTKNELNKLKNMKSVSSFLKNKDKSADIELQPLTIKENELEIIKDKINKKNQNQNIINDTDNIINDTENINNSNINDVNDVKNDVNDVKNVNDVNNVNNVNKIDNKEIINNNNK